MTTESLESPVPPITIAPFDVDISWLLHSITTSSSSINNNSDSNDKSKTTSTKNNNVASISFSINRNVKSCHTPSKNEDILEGIFSFNVLFLFYSTFNQVFTFFSLPFFIITSLFFLLIYRSSFIFCILSYMVSECVQSINECICVTK